MRLIPAVLAVAVFSIGCGEGQPSRDEFAKQATVICQGATRETEALLATVNENTIQPELFKLVREEVVPLLQELMRDIRDLGVPESDQGQLDSALNEAESALESIDDDPSKAISGENPLADLAAVFHSYGITACD